MKIEELHDLLKSFNCNYEIIVNTPFESNLTIDTFIYNGDKIKTNTLCCTLELIENEDEFSWIDSDDDLPYSKYTSNDFINDLRAFNPEAIISFEDFFEINVFEGKNNTIIIDIK